MTVCASEHCPVPLERSACGDKPGEFHASLQMPAFRYLFGDETTSWRGIGVESLGGQQISQTGQSSALEFLVHAWDFA